MKNTSTPGPLLNGVYSLFAVANYPTEAAKSMVSYRIQASRGIYEQTTSCDPAARAVLYKWEVSWMQNILLYCSYQGISVNMETYKKWHYFNGQSTRAMMIP